MLQTNVICLSVQRIFLEAKTIFGENLRGTAIVFISKKAYET